MTHRPWEEITLENVKAVKPGERIYRHKVQISQERTVEEIAVIYVISAEKELSNEDEDQIWDKADAFDWDEVDSTEDPGDIDIVSTNGLVKDRCKFTADMFEDV